MKIISKIVITAIFLTACTTFFHKTSSNYKMIDAMIQNPDTLKVLGRDTIYFPNPDAQTEYREYSEYWLNWFKIGAECFRDNGYKIIDEELMQLRKDSIKFHRIQIQCKTSEMKATITFKYRIKEGYWKFHSIKSANIGERPDANESPP
jgi:hypothetical protein